MVFLTDEINSGRAVPRNLLILQKLKQARAEHEAQNDEASPPDALKASKKCVHKKSLKQVSSSSSSISSENNKLQLIKRSTVQEKLFTAQCERSRQNFEKYRSMLSGTESSTSPINQKQKARVQGNSKYKFQKFNGYINNNSNNNNNNHDDDNDDDNDPYGNEERNDDCNTVGVLHLRKPLKLIDSDDINYFNGQGKMKPIPWSLIHGETNDEKNKNNCKKIDKKIHPPEQIEQSSDAIPIGDADFVNFVNDSTTNDTVYRVHNNMKETIRCANESPILKIQKVIKQCAADAITVTQEIREAFKPSKKEIKLIDLIDKIEVKSTFQNNPPQASKLYDFKNDVNAAMQKIQKRNIEEFKRNQLKEAKSESINILNNSSHVAERKKMIEEYSDDMIDFAKPNSPSTSSLTNSKNLDRNFDSDENSYLRRMLIEKFKNSRGSRVNDCSLDSDDISTERSSELDDISAARRSTSSKYETLKKKLSSVSTQTSPKKKSIDKVYRNLSLLNIEKTNMYKHEEEPLIKECSTRYLKKPAIIIDNTATPEIEEDIPKEEPLLKPLFTRYFTSLPKKEETSNDNKRELVVEENISQTAENNSISNELNISNEISITRDNNTKIEEIVSDPKEIEEIVSDPKEIEEIVSDPKEIEEIVSNPKEIEEIYKDDGITSLSEEFILNIADNKLENDQNCDDTVTSSCEKKDSEESFQLNNENVLHSQTSLNNVKEENNLTEYENIDSDEEYDIVNFEQFSAFNSLLNKLQEVTAAQKEHALSIQNELNNCDSDIDENDSPIHLKAIENSSLDSSKNSISSVNASVSSNLESDNENSANSSSSSNLFFANKNVFENVNINIEHLNNYQLNENEKSNVTEVNEKIEGVTQRKELSSRQQKIANALKTYRQSKDVPQENNNVVQNESLKTEESKKRNQILEEIKKRKLHLNCKPRSAENLIS